MTYTRPWDTNTPLGTRNANEIDDAIREKLVDISERFSTIIGSAGDMTADPIITPDMTSLAATGASLNTTTGSKTSVERSIPWYAGHLYSLAGTTNRTQQYLEITGTSATASILIPIVIPVGAVITQARARVTYNDTGHTITGVVKGTQDTSDIYSVTLVAPVAASASAVWMAPASAPSHTTLATVVYGFLITLANNNINTSTALRLHGLQVLFTSSSAGLR